MNLEARWGDLWRGLEVAAPPNTVFQSLAAAYSSPERAYHNLDHLRDCLAELDGSRSLAEHALEVELALWFHDVVYDTHAADNEAQSAAWALTVLQNAAVEPPVAARVSHLILATRHQAAPAGRDAALVVDIDLSILGREPAEFDRYEAAIRREYQWVAELDFCEARARILGSFLQRERLYQTAAFQARYEAQARANLARSIEKLRGEP